MEPKIRIRIVEDEAIIAENLRFTLEDLGYEVVGTHYSFAEAAAALPAGDADLVMLDIHLGSRSPGETGLRLATLVPAGTPFIFLTAYSDMATIREATRLRPAGYVIKPVNSAIVFAAIQTAIEGFSSGAPAALPRADEQPAAADYFFVKMGRRTVKLCWSDIGSLEAAKNYVRIRPVSGAPEYAVRGSLSFVLEDLVPAQRQVDFVRVSRSVCVNRHFVTAVGSDWVECGGERFENTRLSAKDWEGLLPGR